MEQYKEINGITYMLAGKFYLPTLLPHQETASPLGIWGKRRLACLKRHHRESFSYLLTSGQLNSHLAYVDERAKDMYSILVKQFAVSDGITEEMRARDRIAWERRMNNNRCPCTGDHIRGSHIWMKRGRHGCASLTLVEFHAARSAFIPQVSLQTWQEVV